VVTLTLASLVRLLRMHATSLQGSSSAITLAKTTILDVPAPGTAEDGSSAKVGERLKLSHKAFDPSGHKRRKLENGAAAPSSSSSASASAASGSSAADVATGSASTPQASNLLYPSYGQVLDWLRMLLDAHFTRLVLSARAEPAGRGPTPATGGVRQLLTEVVRIVKSQIELGDAIADLRGYTAHILHRQPLPQPPEPEYGVELLRL
jgi:hypothetical protein